MASRRMPQHLRPQQHPRLPPRRQGATTQSRSACRSHGPEGAGCGWPRAPFAVEAYECRIQHAKQREQGRGGVDGSRVGRISGRGGSMPTPHSSEAELARGGRGWDIERSYTGAYCVSGNEHFVGSIARHRGSMGSPSPDGDGFAFMGQARVGQCRRRLHEHPALE